ncbi:MAG: chorismate-binding protein [Zoogloea sp.]|uniref:chorismate-binding protein n=1 Tax=Zoogloea sp. TaxID=49181 RepID=UPI003F3B9A1A
MTVFALLDDHQSPADAPRSRLYEDWVREYRCAGQSPAEAAGEWRAQWPRIAADLAAGLHGVLLADYEWGVALAGLTPPADARPSLRVLLFRHCRRLSAAQVETWLAARHPRADTPPVAGLMDAEADESAAAFAERIEAIQAAIRRGETYQVNHTFRLNFQAYGDPIALYRRLRARQPVPYGALIALPPTPGSNGPDHVLSLSPELFLRHDPAAGRLITRPMKGTLARSGDPAEDNRRAKALAADPKNRAENLMIVDLLRNDLGRVAQSGSVRVDELFGVEAYGPVLQMSSTISAEPRPGLDFAALLAALFPCGSITGAPKHRTMSLIGRGEPTPRGLDPGAIGWLDGADGPSAQLPAFCLSVAIRTLVLQAPPRRPASPALSRHPGPGRRHHPG